jgi:hypothetical protein
MRPGNQSTGKAWHPRWRRAPGERTRPGPRRGTRWRHQGSWWSGEAGETVGQRWCVVCEVKSRLGYPQTACKTVPLDRSTDRAVARVRRRDENPKLAGCHRSTLAARSRLPPHHALGGNLRDLQVDRAIAANTPTRSGKHVPTASATGAAFLATETRCTPPALATTCTARVERRAPALARTGAALTAEMRETWATAILMCACR